MNLTAGLGVWCWLPMPVIPTWSSEACHTLSDLVTTTTRLVNTIPTTNMLVAFSDESGLCKTKMRNIKCNTETKSNLNKRKSIIYIYKRM